MLSDLILLVDDEPSIIQLARMYLEREGFRTESVGDGEAALEAVAGQRPALIVLDVMLPRLDGFEVCRQLRAKDGPVAILRRKKGSLGIIWTLSPRRTAEIPKEPKKVNTSN